MKYMRIKVVNAFIKKDKKVLAVKRASKFFFGMLALPGGQLEDNESEETALVREVREETGLNIQVIDDRPILKGRFKIGKFDVSIDVFRCKVISGVIRPQESEVDDVEWVGGEEFLKSLKDNNYPNSEINNFRGLLMKEGLVDEN